MEMFDNTIPVMKNETNVSVVNYLDDMPLAMAYVPMQKWHKLYDPEAGLERGTIFMQLDLPFLGAEGLYHG